MKRSVLIVAISCFVYLGNAQIDTNRLELDTIIDVKEETESIIELEAPAESDMKLNWNSQPASSKKIGSLTSPNYFNSGVGSTGGNAPKVRQHAPRFLLSSPAKVKVNNNKRISMQLNSEYLSSKPEKHIDENQDEHDKFYAGQLTGAELSDFDKYELWQHIAKEDFNQYSQLWSIKPTHRHSLQVINEEGRPVTDVPVQLMSKENKILWKARTDNAGSAELWGNGEEGHKIVATVDGHQKVLKHPSLFENGINRMLVQTECNLSDNVDIAFVVDATGSMKDEINYLQVELEDIMKKARKKHESFNFRTASVFYRCTGNEYALRHSDFTDDESTTGKFIKAQKAEEGGAELVDSALFAAVEYLAWSENARARIAFLILDEPPATDSLTRSNLSRYIAKAAEKGIRIVPIVASANYGTEESLEYLMRSIALYTNASYVFLTDDSGIGDPHAKPTVDEYQVELLNKLLARLIMEYTYTPECDQNLTLEVIPDTLVIKEVINSVIVDSVLLAFQDSIRALHPDTVFASEDTENNLTSDWPSDEILVVEEIKVWLNPTMGQLTVEVRGQASEVYLADITGKIISKYALNKEKMAQFDISDNPAGIYMIQCLSMKKWLAGKVILMK